MTDHLSQSGVPVHGFGNLPPEQMTAHSGVTIGANFMQILPTWLVTWYAGWGAADVKVELRVSEPDLDAVVRALRLSQIENFTVAKEHPDA